MVKKFITILIVSVILFAQASFVLAAGEGAECNCTSGTTADCTGSNPTCDAGLKCFCDPDADQGASGPKKGRCAPKNSIPLCDPLGGKQFKDLVNNILDWVFDIAVILAPLMIIVGGIVWIMAGGNPERVKTGKKIITWTCIGFLTVLFARGIGNLIEYIIGVK